jgi:ABC-2 type transport system ATP-binding protein
MGENMTNEAVCVTGLIKRRESFELQGIDLCVRKGFITGLVGPNGAGKTTVIKTLLGLVRADAGQIAVFGEVVGTPAVNDLVGVVLDQIAAAPEWRAGGVGKRIGGLYERWDEDWFQQLLTRFEVPTRNRVDALSRGQSVKLSLAMALAHRPRLLLLDEPSSGLDPVARRELADTIREFMIDPEHTVLFSTHITTELDNLADYIVVLGGGEVVYTGALDDLHEQFAVVRGGPPFPEQARSSTIGLQLETDGGYEALIRADDTAAFGDQVVIDAATTDDVVVHFAAHARQERSAA